MDNQEVKRNTVMEKEKVLKYLLHMSNIIRVDTTEKKDE